MEKKTQFSWTNYFKATPDNLKYISVSLKSLVASLAGTTLIMEANKWVTFSILVSGFVLDELSKFFGHVSDDAKRIVSVEVDASADVVVKDEIKDEVK